MPVKGLFWATENRLKVSLTAAFWSYMLSDFLELHAFWLYNFKAKTLTVILFYYIVFWKAMFDEKSTQ